MPADSRGLFVTGTDTGVGKTYVASLLARSLFGFGKSVGVYKPVATGCRRQKGQLVADDAVSLWDAAGRPASLEQVCPQRYEAPLAPHLAAVAEGKEVDVELLTSGIECWTESSEFVIVEGVGGLMTPLSDDLYVADLALTFGFPLVVVAPNVLGTINQTLQTMITACCFREGIEIAGFVLNDVRPDPHDISQQSNRDELIRHCEVPLLATVRWQAKSIDDPWIERIGGEVELNRLA